MYPCTLCLPTEAELTGKQDATRPNLLTFYVIYDRICRTESAMHRRKRAYLQELSLA